MAPTPQWASELVDRVARDYDIAVPELVWRRSRVWLQSSGHTALMGHRIVVTAGRDRRDQRSTLLHELAHAILWQRGDAESHGEEFYRLLFGSLLPAYGRAPWREVLERETYAVAYRVAQELGIRGAKKAAAQRRSR